MNYLINHFLVSSSGMWECNHHSDNLKCCIFVVVLLSKSLKSRLWSGHFNPLYNPYALEPHATRNLTGHGDGLLALHVLPIYNPCIHCNSPVICEKMEMCISEIINILNDHFLLEHMFAKAHLTPPKFLSTWIPWIKDPGSSVKCLMYVIHDL